MGHAAPFAFDDGYAPADDIARFLCGTPPILGLAALEEGVKLFEEVAFDTLVAKSRSLSSLFVTLMDDLCGEHGFTLASPRDPAARGSHVSYGHPEAYAICQALIARGVVGDFRAPDILRLGFTPLYTSHEDVWRAVDTLAAVMRERAWDRAEYRQRAAVT
jgi:kynureninase